MFDSVKADLYQLFRSKIFWGVEIFLFIYGLVTAFFQLTNEGDITTLQQVKDLLGNTIAIPENHLSNTPWTGVEALSKSSFNFTSALVVAVAIAMLLLGGDFLRKYHKNTLSKGLSRTQFFWSKNITVILMAAVNLLFYYVMVFVGSSLLHGVGDLSLSFLSAFLLTIVVQLVICMTIIQLVNLLIYWTHSPAAGIGGFLLYAITLSLPSKLLPNIEFLNFTSIDFNIVRAENLTVTLFFVALNLVEALVFGYFALKIFKRQDL